VRGAKKSPAALAGGAAALGGTPRHSEAPGSPGRRRAASRIRRGPQQPIRLIFTPLNRSERRSGHALESM